MTWFEKLILKRWLKEIELNINGFRKMAKGYESMGGFKEVKETLEKYHVDLGIPDELLERGRKAELKFVEICKELAECYEELLSAIERKVSDENT